MSRCQGHLLLFFALLAIASYVALAFKSTGGAPRRIAHRSNSIYSDITQSGMLASRRSRAMIQMGLFDSVKKSADGSSVQENISNAKLIDKYNARVEKINSLEAEIEALSDDALKERAAALRARVAGGAALDAVTEEAFALVREAAWRVLELRHYDVQLMGGLALAEGRLAEMATGEGKTLVATLPVFLHALAGRGAHVVTANDYLAKRDADLMGQVHRFLGLSVGLVQGPSTPEQRRAAYACDVTYLTNAELGFDYLRDNLAMTPGEVVQGRPFNFCLVDEADSILIDEARTPLIISEQVDGPKVKFENSAKIVNVLQKDYHYVVDEKGQTVQFTEEGMTDCANILKKDLFDPNDPWAAYLQNAVKAKELFAAGNEYIVRDGEVAIVDQFSGRVLEGRRFADGLHQALEAKEGLAITKQSKVIATVTYQSLFKSFPVLAGMSGTAKTEAAELEEIYELEVVQVPTALPVARRDYDDVIYRTKEAKVRALLGEVARVHELGEPVLIGTTSVEDSEAVAAQLREEGIEVAVLNAKPGNIDREAEVVAQAGRVGRVTVATNMAGRGTDILLGGNPAAMARIQLRNTFAKEVASEQELAMCPDVGPGFYPAELSEAAKGLLASATEKVVASMKKGEATKDEIEELITVASEAGPSSDPAVLAVREAFNTIKAEYAKPCKEEKEKVLALGGLYVLGTEKHESRRIDNQLRGRAGRQGDPGGSRFFLSLEDETFRVFGGDRFDNILKTFRLGDDIPLEAKPITESVEKVQKQVEEYFAGIRLQVFQFDDVLNDQREAVYARRSQILASDDGQLMDGIKVFCLETANEIIPNYVTKEGTDAAKLSAKLKQFFTTITDLDEAKMSTMKMDALAPYVHERVLGALAAKAGQLDAQRAGMAASAARYLALVNYDQQWQAHLGAMAALKEGAGIKRFGGEDPLDMYKRDSFTLFQNLFNTVKLNTVYSYFIYNPQQK